MTTSHLAGRLLVASPALDDPNFARTVVLVLDHGEEGALGLVLNRPSETAVGEALPDWANLAAPPGVVFVGGPVSPSAAICLARGGEGEGEGWKPLFGELGTADLGRPPDEVIAALEQVRVFAGYAGWGAGQLEGEIGVGAWFVVEAQPGDALCLQPGDLWRQVLRRQRGRLALLSTYPDDVNSN